MQFTGASDAFPSLILALSSARQRRPSSVTSVASAAALDMSAQRVTKVNQHPDDSTSESAGSSSLPLTPPTTCKQESDLPLAPSTPSPRHSPPDSPFPTPPSSSSPPPASQSEGPFEGLVFGVLPDQWEPEVLLEAQRMIVVSSVRLSPTGLPRADTQLGGGKVRRPGSPATPPPELLLLPLMYEQRIPGSSLITPLPAGWHDLKFVVTPWVVSCHLLGRRIGYERSILLGLDPSIMTPSGPDVTPATTAMGLRHSAADPETELLQTNDRHAAEVAALHKRLQTQQEELNRRRTSLAALAEEITENLKGFLRVELERQIQAFVTDNRVRHAFTCPRSDVNRSSDALDLHSPSSPEQETAERTWPDEARAVTTAGTLGSTDLTATSQEDQPEPPTSEMPALTAQKDSRRCALPAQLPAITAGTAMRSLRDLCFPSKPMKRQTPHLSQVAPPAKRPKSRPYWYRIFG